MSRTFVENIEGDAGDPAVVWELVGTVDSTGGRLGFRAQYLDGVGEPRDLEVYGAQPSRFHGIDGTPECEGVVAFVAEHFAETTSITSCQQQAAGSMRGLLVHREEAGHFQSEWSEADGITRLNWTVTVTHPSEGGQCVLVRHWLAEHTGLAPGTCQFAEGNVRWDDGGPFLEWVVRGILNDSSAGVTNARPFEAWVNDGEARPFVFKVHAPAEWEYPPAE